MYAARHLLQSMRVIYFIYSPKISHELSITNEILTREIFTLLTYFTYILQNSDDSQFSLKEILEKFDGDLPRLDYIRDRLINNLGDQIQCYQISNDIVICFTDTQGRIKNEWYTQKAPTLEEERLRIVEMAANIILQDVRNRHHDTHNYKAASCFLSDVASDISRTLQLFLNIHTCKKK